MSNADLFQSMAQHWAAGEGCQLHNVRVLAVAQGQGVYEILTVECQGVRADVVGGRWMETHANRNVDKVGYLTRASSFGGEELPAGACAFYAYPDQSLRRVPELDAVAHYNDPEGRLQAIVGWRCDEQPTGFRAPLGLIPGAGGRFVRDETVRVTVRVPPEFDRECRSVQRSPAEVLQSFIGDLAGIGSYVDHPRADGFGSNGSDERMYAEQWLERAHGHDKVDIYALETRDAEDAERQADYDDLASLLDEYVSNGGKPTDFLKAVGELVDKKGDVKS